MHLPQCFVSINNSCQTIIPNRLTIDVVIKRVPAVRLLLDKNGNCLAVYLDLSKAFDTVNHDILLRRLTHYGIRGKSLEWL